MELLLKYDWPGNVRELENAIKRAAVLSRSDVILVENLTPEIIAGPRKAEREASALESALEHILKAKVKQAINRNSHNLYDDILNMVDKSLINLVLHEVNDNQVKAAQLLGISRTTLREKIKKLEISILPFSPRL
jgi:two-component system nitrogen regulation response regulator GlnG